MIKHHLTTRSVTSFQLAALGAALLIALGLAESSSAAIIGPTPPTLSGPVGITDIAPVLTTAPNNDNDGAPTNPPNRLELLHLQFTGTGSIDVVYPISDSGGTTEYALGLGTSLGFISTSIVNSSGVPWSGMQVSIGSGTGGSFTPAAIGGGFDFDTPGLDPTPASDKFGFFQNWGNKMNFLGNIIPPGPNEDFAAHFIMTANMDLPDGLGSDFTLRLTPLLAADQGQSQDNPALPTSVTSNSVVFSGATRGRWFDPPTAYGFEYNMLNDGDLFTEILDFPTGFANDFEVLVGNTSLGLFGPGDSVTFPGSGVTSFQVIGINPLVDPENPAAFPLQLDFNNETVDFSMTALNIAVPEPATLALAAFGLEAIGFVRRRQRVSL